jgi:transposase InsO family protein
MFVTLTCTRFERSLSPVLDVLHEWLDSWSGIGVIVRGLRDAELVLAQSSPAHSRNYNHQAPHSALDMRPPSEYRASLELTPPSV